MYPAPFKYLTATSHDDAVALLAEYGEDAKLLAGGQSLVAMMNLRLLQPTCLIDINELPCPPVRREDGTLAIPAGTRHVSLLRSPEVAMHAPMVTEAARRIGNVRVRSRGTVGGSVAHADPAAELPSVLTALDADIVTHERQGGRVIPARDFFVGYLTTALHEAEMVVAVRIPARRPGTGQGFAEYTRRANDFAVAMAAAVVEARDGRCVRARLVLGGVGDRPVAVDETATEILAGNPFSEEALEQVGEQAAVQVDPSDGVHGSGDYRRRLVRTLGAEALRAAWRRAEEVRA